MPSSVSPATRDVVVDAEEPVFVQLVAALQRPVAQLDVVRLRAGEVLHRRAAALGLDAAQVGLVAAAQPHARLGVALAEHALDARVGDEARPSRPRCRRRCTECRCRRTSRGRGAGCPPAMNSAAGVVRAEMRTQLVARRRPCRPAGGGPGRAAGPRRALRICASFFAPMPWHRADAAGARGGCEVVEAGDAERRVQPRHGLRARRPAAAAGRASWAETLRAASW